MNEDLSSESDENIFLKMADNPESFGIIMDRYDKKLGNYIRRNSGLDNDSINDLLQDIFLSVYQNANSFRFDMKFSSWIYRIAHNKMIDHWRVYKKNKIQISLEENIGFVETFFNKNDVAEEIEKIESKEIVEKVMLFVKPKYREVLVLRFLEGYSYEEISDILQKTKSTVGTLVARGKKDFKKQMENIISSKNKI
jgi:RNA polymerase sigma-70 factor (ECF subfamily)